MHIHCLCYRMHILIPPPRQTDNYALFPSHGRGQLEDVRNRVGRLERRDDTLFPGKRLETLQRLVIGYRSVLGPPCILEPRMLRPDARIIESCRDRMGMGNLTVTVLQQVRLVAMENAYSPGTEWSRVVTGGDTIA